ncbi:unnamed protein product [Cunninghamella echinulata]
MMSLSIPTIRKTIELPPTPTSSYCRSFISRDDSTKLTCINTDNSMERIDRSSSKLLSTRNYGSFISIPPLSEDNLSLHSATPSTPSHTTINPNEDDESLYLLWAQQLLREQGIRPSSSFRTKSFQYDDNDDYSDESSLSDISVSTSFLSSFFSSCCT